MPVAVEIAAKPPAAVIRDDEADMADADVAEEAATAARTEVGASLSRRLICRTQISRKIHLTTRKKKDNTECEQNRMGDDAKRK